MGGGVDVFSQGMCRVSAEECTSFPSDLDRVVPIDSYPCVSCAVVNVCSWCSRRTGNSHPSPRLMKRPPFIKKDVPREIFLVSYVWILSPDFDLTHAKTFSLDHFGFINFLSFIGISNTRNKIKLYKPNRFIYVKAVSLFYFI